MPLSVMVRIPPFGSSSRIRSGPTPSCGPRATARPPGTVSEFTVQPENAARHHLPALGVDPDEPLWSGALPGDRDDAVLARPAHREPSVPADPRHAHRPPTRDVDEVDARAAARAPAPRVGEREPAPVRRDAQARAAAERADRPPDLPERAGVEAEQQVASMAVFEADERLAGGRRFGARRRRDPGANEQYEWECDEFTLLIRASGRKGSRRLLYLLACKQSRPRPGRWPGTSASCSRRSCPQRAASSSPPSTPQASRSPR